MTLGISKAYTPSSNQTANSTSYNTDLAALFNAFSGLEAQTSSLGGLTITPASDGTTRFKITNVAGTELLSADTTNFLVKIAGLTITPASDGTTKFKITNAAGTELFSADTTNSAIKLKATSKLYFDGGGNTYIVEGSADDLSIFVGGVTYIDMKSNSVLFPKDLNSNEAGVTNIGDAVLYFGDVSYKTLTDRGCLGCFDDGVELQDGTKVSDTEALKTIKKHPTKLTVYGIPMFDYKTFPKVSYKRADKQGELLPRDENDEPIGGADGVEMTSMFSIMIGAIKELADRIEKLEV